MSCSIWGISLDNRDVEHVFQQTCKDGNLYLLNMSGYTWSCLTGSIAPRAYRPDVFRKETLYILLEGFSCKMTVQSSIGI